MLIVEGMPAGYTNKLIQDIQDVPGVSSAVWSGFSSLISWVRIRT